MADRYAATGAQTVTATPGDTVLAITGASTIRGRIFDLAWGSIATPADNVIQWLVRRATALGTSTSVTSQKLDSAAPTGLTLAGENHTTEPTFAAGSELIDIGLNQRASWRWVAVPEGEIVVPASATAAVGITPIGSGGGDVSATAMWVE